jgi:hypothetical protein
MPESEGRGSACFPACAKNFELLHLFSIFVPVKIVKRRLIPKFAEAWKDKP